MKLLGHIAAKYESGNAGPGTISSGKGDPGGKSYGVFQLSGNAGTLARYLKQSQYRRLFERTRIGSKKFDQKWRTLATRYPQDFAHDQHVFIERTHYAPIRRYASKLGIKNTQAINEALFSISVQHGGAAKILEQANVRGDTEKRTIEKLYAARSKYVSGLRSLNSRMKRSILRRYVREEYDVTKLISGDGGVERRRPPVVIMVIAFIAAIVAAFFGA